MICNTHYAGQKVAYIYKLIDPREPDKIRYVGKTNNVTKRLQNHIQIARRREKKYFSSNWIYSLLAENVHPELHIIETIFYDYEEYWHTFESFYITLYKKMGHPLTNFQGGGGPTNTGVPHTDETKAKISLKAKGRNHSEATRIKMSKSHTGVKRGPMSDEARRNMSAAQKGKGFSPEARAKAIQTKQGKYTGVNSPKYGVPVPPEVRAKMSKSHTGKTLPEEVRKKISAGNKGKHKGRTLSEETRKKIGASQLGRKVSQETKDKRRLTLLKQKIKNITIVSLVSVLYYAN